LRHPLPGAGGEVADRRRWGRSLPDGMGVRRKGDLLLRAGFDDEGRRGEAPGWDSGDRRPAGDVQARSPRVLAAGPRGKAVSPGPRAPSVTGRSHHAADPLDPQAPALTVLPSRI